MPLYDKDYDGLTTYQVVSKKRKPHKEITWEKFWRKGKGQLHKFWHRLVLKNNRLNLTDFWIQTSFN